MAGGSPPLMSAPLMMSYLGPSDVTMHPLERLLGFTLINPQRDAVYTKSLAVNDGMLAVYFTAQWCLPSLTFTPVLRQLYIELKRWGRGFEVVMVSFDRQEQEFNKLYSAMPWLAVAFDDYPKRVELGRRYAVTDLPKLILFDVKTVSVIARDGREIVLSDPLGKQFPWRVSQSKQQAMPQNTQSRRSNSQSPKRNPPWHQSTNGFSLPNNGQPMSSNLPPAIVSRNQRLGNVSRTASVSPIYKVHSFSNQAVVENQTEMYEDPVAIRPLATTFKNPAFLGMPTTPIQLVKRQADYPEVMAKVLENREKQMNHRICDDQPHNALHRNHSSPRVSKSDALRELSFEPTEAYGKSQEGENHHFWSYHKTSRGAQHREPLNGEGGHGDVHNIYYNQQDDDLFNNEINQDRRQSKHKGSLPSSSSFSDHKCKDRLLPTVDSICPKIVVEPWEQTSLMSAAGRERHRPRTRSTRRSESQQHQPRGQGQGHGQSVKSERSPESPGRGDDTTCSTEILYLTTTTGPAAVNKSDRRTPRRSAQLHKMRPADFPRSSSAHYSFRQN